MNRLIFSPAQVLQDTDLGNMQRNDMIALGYLAQAMVGSASIVVDGLVCAPTAPPSMVVNVGPGAVFALATIDATTFGSLLSDSNPLVKMGVNYEGVTPFTLTAPGSSGQSINYLIEATLEETDTGSTVLEYFNPSNPTQPFSGPANDGVAQNTQRNQIVELQLKAGTAATTGTQTTPAVDSGWVGLYVIQVNFGASSVTSGNITIYPTAPFIPAKLGPGMVPGFANTHPFVTSGTSTFTVPNGITKIKCHVWGGGAGGGSADVSGGAGSGGSGGGYAEGIFTVAPGQALTVTVGAGGAGSVTGSAPGGNGGTSSVGSLISATGGTGGISTSTTTAPLGPTTQGSGTGGAINDGGGPAGAGYIITASTLAVGGFGGSSHNTSVSFGNTALGIGGNGPGGAGSGGANGNHGGPGFIGRVVIEF